MLESHSVAEVRSRLSRLLDAVARGGQVELTRRGKPVAMLVSVEEYRRLTGGPRNFAKAYAKHRERFAGLERGDVDGLRSVDPGRRVPP